MYGGEEFATFKMRAIRNSQGRWIFDRTVEAVCSRHRGRLFKGKMGKRLLPNYVFTCILGVAGSRQYKAYMPHFLS